MKLRTHSGPNSDVITFHTRRRVTRQSIIHAQKGVKERLPRLAQELLAIRGITEVFLQAHEVQLTKATLFSWDELTPQVLNTLKNVFQVKDIISV